MSTITGLTHVTVIVDDQEEALEFYTETLGFAVRSDEEMPGEGGRWLTVGVPGNDGTELTLVPADTPEKRDLVGRQAADLVLFVVETDDCQGLFETYRERGVTVTTEPEEVPWGVHATFADLYGNQFNVVEPAE